MVSTRVLELETAPRRVDSVLRLRRGHEVYLRHLEFQSRGEPRLTWRLFEYASRLAARFRLPVLTTVVFLRPPAPRIVVHREQLGGRTIHERHFEVLRLWELDPKRLLELGPGAAALVGPAASATLPVIKAAAARIRAHAPAGQHADLLAVLQVLSEGPYTASKLAEAIPQEVVMGSSLFTKVKRMARAEGRVAGQVEMARQICTELMRRHHPAVADRVVSTITATSSLSQIRGWALEAAQLSDEAMVRLVTSRRPPTAERVAATRSRQRRTSRPARRNAAARR